MLDPFFRRLLHDSLRRVDENFPPPQTASPTTQTFAGLLVAPTYLTDLQQVSPDFNWPLYFQEDINRGLSRLWSPSTLKTYSTGVNAYIHFCQLHRIPTPTVFPASEPILFAFFSNKLHLAPATLKNYLAGLRAWHTRNNKPFPNSRRLRLLAISPRPPATPPAIKEPVQLEDLLVLHAHLDFSSSLDIACFSCALVAFFGLCRLGELIPTSPNQDTNRFPSLKSLTIAQHNAKITLPWTKVGHFNPVDVFLPEQKAPLDPVRTLRDFVLQRPPGPYLFSFSKNSTGVPLTKHIFLSRINFVLSNNGRHQLTGHSFRIGGTSHFLLCGIHPDIIKQHGRWSSDSFLRYWRNLDTVIPSNVRFAEPGLSSGGPQRSRHGRGQASRGCARDGT